MYWYRPKADPKCQGNGQRSGCSKQGPTLLWIFYMIFIIICKNMFLFLFWMWFEHLLIVDALELIYSHANDVTLIVGDSVYNPITGELNIGQTDPSATSPNTRLSGGRLSGGRARGTAACYSALTRSHAAPAATVVVFYPECCVCCCSVDWIR